MNIKIDSRKVVNGDTFIAIQTLNNDGHDYIDDAIKRGAVKIIAQEEKYKDKAIIVSDTREYISKYLKENYYNEIKDLKLIGITGTNGKTTSSYLIYQALNEIGIKCAYIGTIGFYMNGFVKKLDNTTPELLDIYELLIECVKNGIEYVVMEVSSHALSLKRVEGLFFDIAIFTNLTVDHLDYHKNMDNYRKEKEKLFNMCNNAIINIDDKYSSYFIKENNKNYTYGKNESDYLISDIKISDNSTVFYVTHENNKVLYKTKLLGEYNVYNLLNTIIVLDLLDINDEVKKEVVSKLEHPNGRLEVINYNSNKIIIDYAHTPDAISKVIDCVKSFSKGKLITIVGCGGNRDKSKRPLMASIALKNSDYCIFTSDNPRFESQSDIFNDMLKGINKSNYNIIESRSLAIKNDINIINDNDILLILGKGHEDYQIIDNKKIHFSDKEEVLKNISI